MGSFMVASNVFKGMIHGNIVLYDMSYQHM